MQNERVRINLDHPEKTYFAGQTIHGKICFNFIKRTKIRAIKVQITGKGKCKWIEILRKNSNYESSHSLFYTSKEVYAHSENALPVFEPRGIELSAGEHSFDFFTQLEWHLPSSFKGSHGSIKYKLRIVVQRPWAFDERHVIPLVVIKYMPLPSIYRVNPTSIEKQVTKTISLFGTRPITMVALLPEDVAIRGEPFRVCVTVENNSATNIEKLRFSILQHVKYFSHVPLRIQKLECVSIASKETGSIHKKSERSFAHELLIPSTAQPTDEELSGVIKITYELRVEAVLRGFFKNLVLNLPFKVYSSEVDSTRVIAPMLLPAPQAGVNPFEASAAILPVYPSLDPSIGSSPSHSSQYSESSCSINSTTSDSSAVTLSPAVRGTERPHVSSSPSQFNSPAARASLRSSNVPYMHYSSSPLMISSYPPYALPDSSLYMPMPHQNTTPPPVQHLLPSTPTSFRFGQRPAPGSHELPPSYEELFGSATAPPQEAPK